MVETFKKCLWSNFGGAIDMLSDTIANCTDEMWYREKKFFYMAFHTSIFLDYYLSYPVKEFSPALPYTIVPQDKMPGDAIDDVIPDKYYSRQELLEWLIAVRQKCKNLILQSTEEQFNSKWIEADEIDLHGLCPSIVVNYSLLEILFYNFRHVQHHVGQLNFMLRQNINTAADWVAHAE